METIIEDITKYCSTVLGLGELAHPRQSDDFTSYDLCYAIHTIVNKRKGDNVDETVKQIGEEAQKKLAEQVCSLLFLFCP